MLLDEVNTKLINIAEELRNNKQTTDYYIKQYRKYHKQLIVEYQNIRDTGTVSDYNIESIHKVCNEAGIDCTNIHKDLSLEEMDKELLVVDDVLRHKLWNKHMIVPEKKDTLLWHIHDNKPIPIEYDTRDTQSIRNVIGISIAVCAIVTLCIVLLIVVCNKNRTNAEVRLLNEV